MDSCDFIGLDTGGSPDHPSEANRREEMGLVDNGDTRAICEEHAPSERLLLTSRYNNENGELEHIKMEHSVVIPSEKRPVLMESGCVAEFLAVSENLHIKSNGRRVIVSDRSSTEPLIDESPLAGTKRPRLSVAVDQPSVRVIYNSLTRESKKKLTELMKKWSEWHANSLSSDKSSGTLENGEEIYFPALRIVSEKSSMVEFDSPPWLHRMHEMGYPPGYLDVAEDGKQPSGITIVGEENTKAEAKEGELHVVGEPESYVKRMAVNFPGINEPIPEGADKNCSSSHLENSRSSNRGMDEKFKSGLQEYAQKRSIELPVYQTSNEGSQHEPRFKSSVIVDGLTFMSTSTFRRRKDAEHDAARVALDGVHKKVKMDVISLIQQDLTFCKSILNEFAVKSTLSLPTYSTCQSGGSTHRFSSSVVLDGKIYVGPPGKNKKEAEQLAARTAIDTILGSSDTSMIMSQIIKTKKRLHSASKELFLLNNSNGLETEKAQIGSQYLDEKPVCSLSQSAFVGSLSAELASEKNNASEGSPKPIESVFVQVEASIDSNGPKLHIGEVLAG